MKTKFSLGASAILLVACFAAPASAQYMYGGWPTYSSTLEEGIQHGFADVIRSQGASNLLNSAASINWNASQRIAISNRQLWTQTYFQMQQMNRQYRDQKAMPKPSTEDLYRFAKQDVPERLSPTELDPLTAAIDWPMALRGTDFDEDRKKMEELFTKRMTPAGAANPEVYKEIARTGEQMQAELGRHIGDYTANVYLAGKNFIRSLMYESSLPPSS